VIFGIFIASIIKELFGGTGAYPLHPVLLARMILQTSFPGTMAEPMLLAGEGSLWTLGTIGLGGILLANQRKNYWETPALFIVVCFGCGTLNTAREMSPTFLSGVLFTAFFLLSDPVAMPLTRKGSAFFVVGAALLSSFLEPGGFSISGALFALLWMNLLTPWLDAWLKPVSFKTKRLVKATYPI
jgi:Na+-translocating ferredoxin:NAD+ oxidoreductase RnfD subunit